MGVSCAVRILAPYKTIKAIWEKAGKSLEVTDLAFIIIRIVIFCGGFGWLVFSRITHETFINVGTIFSYLSVYSIFIYIWLFISPQRKKLIYGAALVFDLLFAALLVRVTGGFESSFFNGFYLITALYSFYFGLVPGTFIAASAASLYYVSCNDGFNMLHWTDFMVRVAFLFLLAAPLGLLSEKLKKDKQKIEDLNKDLEVNIKELRSVQGKLVQVEKLSALGRLTADVAHEIRNPLTSIGGFARRLHKKLSDGSREKGYAEIVVSEVDRLERILRDVLSFSRETKYKMERQEINVPIKESIQAFADICSDQGIRIEENLTDPLPRVLIDRDQVRQAVNNLVSNAIDVMSGGGKLSIKTYMQELYEVNYVVVEVSDTGPGMPEEALYRIFEPFYTTKEIGIGTGLGLAICKKILDEHNGLIFAESKTDRGTTFKMLFPYQSEENGARIKCWEFNRCGVEKAEGAANMRCPAYPDYGRVCWAVAGTFCGKKVSGAIAQKLGNCKKCGFYQRVAVRKDL
ncbi:MAG: sensor histidine kinase [Nitrospiraceae bacterium]|nr:MAG: sensor histidine kinase [Nitrospiraceae bacterium]